MPIEKVDAYMGACDGCKEPFIAAFSDYGIFADLTQIKDEMMEDDWVIDGDKTFCPKCRPKEEDTDDDVPDKKDDSIEGIEPHDSGKAM